MLDDVGGVEVEHAHLGREHDQPVAAAHVAGRAQAVAVERRDDLEAVARDRRRAVPRLDQAAWILVERPHGVVGDRSGVGPGGRDQHGQRVRERAAAEHEQLERGVELGRVRPALVDDREQLLQVVAQERRAQLRLARVHPVGVAAHRVDLAVVGEQVERVREIPGAERVGREARVDERERALEAGIAQVGVVGAELRSTQQALVHEPLRGQADDRELRLGNAGGRGRALDPAADHVQLAPEGGLIAGAALDEELAHDRLACAREPPDAVAVDGHVAPAERPLALLGADAHAQLLAAHARGRVAGQEDESRRVVARRRQLVSERLPERGAQEPVRQLRHDPGAVAGVGIGAGRPTVVEVLEGAQGLPDQLVRGPAVEADERREAAGGVLEPGVVQAGRERRRHSTSVADLEPYRSLTSS